MAGGGQQGAERALMSQGEREVLRDFLSFVPLARWGGGQELLSAMMSMVWMTNFCCQRENQKSPSGTGNIFFVALCRNVKNLNADKK